MRLRLTVASLALAAVLVVAPAAALASPSGVVISQFRTRTASSQFDEYLQIANTTGATVDLSGWQLYDCFTSGGKNQVGTDSEPLPAGTELPAGKSFVFGKDIGDYSGVADASYRFQVTETGGFQLRDIAGTVQDAVGAPGRSEERRVGKECPSKCRSRWSPYH